MKRALWTVCCVCVLALSACQTTAGDGAAVNANCPISGNAVDPEAPTVSYAGQSVGFCCGNCPAKWDEWSDEQKSEFVAQFKQ